MSNYHCHFCGSSLVLTGDECCDMPDLKVGKCTNCSLTQLVSFDHIVDGFYENDKALPVEIKLEQERQIEWNRNRISILHKYLPEINKKTILDFGCGTGGFLEQGSQIFNKAIGYDLNKRICNVHLSNDLECTNNLDQIHEEIEVISLFHVLEHVKKPWELLLFLKKRFAKCKEFILEVPNTNEALNQIFFSKSYKKNHYSMQHLWYFTPETFEMIVKKANLNIAVKKQYQRYTLGNTVGWLANDKGGGQNLWPFFNNKELHLQYEKVLVKNEIADSIFYICNL